MSKNDGPTPEAADEFFTTYAHIESMVLIAKLDASFDELEGYLDRETNV